MPQMASQESLTAFLLAVDLSREIGKCIFHLGEGGLSALKGYQPAISNPGKSNSAAEKPRINSCKRLYSLVTKASTKVMSKNLNASHDMTLVRTKRANLSRGPLFRIAQTSKYFYPLWSKPSRLQTASILSPSFWGKLQCIVNLPGASTLQL